ncbi:MAG: BamA/TamA family outer membrane protein, partial [candidate division Zixibacteria bacterium]|nr:BamA/TamA family outer membrane protein [candidate division Zixibacteria bacterium]
EILIQGNNPDMFSERKIKSSLFSRRSQKFPQESLNIFRAIQKDRRRRVQRETVRRDTSEVKYLYLSSGFLGVQVMEIFEPILPDSTARIIISIHEGRQFLYQNIKVEGDYNEEFGNRFSGIAGEFKIGKPVDPFKLRQATYDMKSVLANEGFPYASIDYRIDTLSNSNNADVTFNIIADSLVHFGNVLINGANKFDTMLVKREISFNPGDKYRREDIIKTQKHLLETGYYLTLYLSSASADTSDKVDRLKPDFTLNLREKKTHFVSLKTGAAQDSLKDLTWTFSGTWGKRNMLRSRRLELTANASFIVFTEWRLKDHWYRARLTEPWFFGIRMPMTVTAQLSPGAKTPILDQDYRKESWFISVSTARYLDDQTRLITGLQYESVNIYGLSQEDQDSLKQDEGISIRRKLFGNLTRDTRNHPFMPSRGSLVNIRAEYIGGFLGGDDSFTLLEASWSKYQKVWPGWISAFRLKAGYVREFDNSESVPLNDRYYIGGANSIRGFSEGSLGPKLQTEDGIIPAGANIIIVANQEFRFRLIGKFWGSIFGDIGNGFRNKLEIKWDRLAVSYGAGIQFISPAGPIRVDYARRLETDYITSGDKFHFTILYAF